MTYFFNKTFCGLFDRGNRLSIENMSFEKCLFENCALSLTEDINMISNIKNVEISDCAVNGCDTGSFVASNVLISGLKTNDLLTLWSPYMDRVVLSGNVGKIKINAEGGAWVAKDKRQLPFDAYRDNFYKNVDWALDISKARFKDFDMRGVPGRLVKRDPESQILITRERALQIATPGWEKMLSKESNLWAFAISLFIGDGDDDTVLVAPLGAIKSKRDPLLKGLHELRRIGLAEPD